MKRAYEKIKRPHALKPVRLLAGMIALAMMSGSWSFAAEVPELFAGAAYVGVLDQDKPLYVKDAKAQHAIASLSKIMTVELVLDAIESGQISWDDEVVVSKAADAQKGSSMRLVEGEVVTVNELVHGTMILSANDAAYALGEFLGGDVDQFVEKMNSMGQTIGMDNFLFINPNGLPEENDAQNIATPEDIFKLSQYVIEEHGDILLPITSTKEYTHNGNVKKSTNNLLKLDAGYDGLKTGYTDSAGYCLVSTINIPVTEFESQPHRLVMVTMGANSDAARIQDHVRMKDYITAHFSTREIIAKDQVFKTIDIEGSEENRINLVPEKSVTRYCDMDTAQDRYHVFVHETVTLPVYKGQVIGSLVMLMTDGSVEQVHLVSDRTILDGQSLLKSKELE